MITINANTKISTILRAHPAAMETIIAMASKIGGCTVEDFFTRLEKLGFIVDKEKTAGPGIGNDQPPGPSLLQHLAPGQLVELDVRPLITAGHDPLNTILEKVRALQPDMVLKIVNSFTPLPLIALLSKKGFRSWSDEIEDDVVNTYFLLDEAVAPSTALLPTSDAPASPSTPADWATTIARFAGNLLITHKAKTT